MAVLSTKGISYKLTLVDPTADNRFQLAPFGTVPILKDGSLSMSDSAAINEYLDDEYKPRLSPEDAGRLALNRSWILQSGQSIKGILAMGMAKNRLDFQARSSSLDRLIRPIEFALSGSPYFNGSTISLVDASFMPFLIRHASLTAFLGFDPLQFSDRLVLWRDSVVRALGNCSEFHAAHGETFLNYLVDKNPFINTLRNKC